MWDPTGLHGCSADNPELCGPHHAGGGGGGTSGGGIESSGASGASSPAPVHPGTKAWIAWRAQEGSPSQFVGCTTADAGAFAFLRAEVPPPCGFEDLYYRPVPVSTLLGWRYTNTHGDVCSQVPDHPYGHDFAIACQTHDYGYDLWRFGAIEDRADVDTNFHIDLMSGQCAPLGVGTQSFEECGLLAESYYVGVRTLGGFFLDRRPWWARAAYLSRASQSGGN
jgi:hypothetical protein